MEHRETEEMHEAVDQMLRSALIAVGSVQQRLARRQQVAADQARMVAAASRTETDAYAAAQDTMLRQSLRPATDPRWFDTSTPAERVATRDMADRFAEVSPYAKTVLDHIDTEAARRGETLTPPETGGPETTPTTGTTDLGKPEPGQASTDRESPTPLRPIRRGLFHDRGAAAEHDKVRAANLAGARTWSNAEDAAAGPAPGSDLGRPDPNLGAVGRGDPEPDAVTTDTETPPPPPTPSGPARRRPIAVDTAATEQEVADRLAASRSFPRPLWDKMRRDPGMKLRPGSPTTLPRSRDKDLGL